MGFNFLFAEGLGEVLSLHATVYHAGFVDLQVITLGLILMFAFLLSCFLCSFEFFLMIL